MVIIRSINKQKVDTYSTRALVLDWRWRWSSKKLLPAHNGDAMLYALLYLHLRILATLSLYFFFLLLLFFFLFGERLSLDFSGSSLAVVRLGESAFYPAIYKGAEAQGGDLTSRQCTSFVC